MLAISFRRPETQGRHTSSHCTVELGRISLKDKKRGKVLLPTEVDDPVSQLDQEAMRSPAFFSQLMVARRLAGSNQLQPKGGPY